jgi:hypothetical protein
MQVNSMVGGNITQKIVSVNGYLRSIWRARSSSAAVLALFLSPSAIALILSDSTDKLKFLQFIAKQLSFPTWATLPMCTLWIISSKIALSGFEHVEIKFLHSEHFRSL